MTSTPIKTVDRERLYTDILYRFKYVSEFVGFGDTDIKAIKDAAPLIGPLVPVIVDAVYAKLFTFDVTKKIFLQKNDGFHGHLAHSMAELTTDDEQVKFRKDFLAKYLVKLVTAEYDAKFIKYLDWVGKIHTSTPEKKSRINVEYIHCNALFGWLHGFLAETVDKLPELQSVPETRAKTLAAFSKLLWIQNDFFAMYYLRNDERFVGDTGRTTGGYKLNVLGISGEKGLATVMVFAAFAATIAWSFKK
ncbi:hypothetical protein HK100_003857 [Physocladia obscura]|uniref:Globin-sensor domain-containing protein n=1 Tax=Physocladia obscura TaxID=109957 RepID=A0AAD5TBS3_9FUNG|nr:hypothetical protein HK100_003857 [Physocladia obscura]